MQNKSGGTKFEGRVALKAEVVQIRFEVFEKLSNSLLLSSLIKHLGRTYLSQE
ncbi:unnamed protein product [Musa acuminata subsp. burmannicoides]